DRKDHTLDIDAGFCGGIGICTYGVDLASECRQLQNDDCDNQHYREDPDGGWNSDIGGAPECQYCLVEWHHLVAGKIERNSSSNEQSGKRGDEGSDAQLGHDEGVGDTEGEA